MVTAVEKASIQSRFIADVARKLGCENRLQLVSGDAFRFVESASSPRDFIFADPPYDHPKFGEIARMVLDSKLMGDDTLFVMEHSKAYDYSGYPEFDSHRAYGSVNFTLFRKSGKAEMV